VLRIARTKKSIYLSTENPDDQHFAQYQQLIKLIKKHLSPVTASIFAQPMLQNNNDDIEWYSDLNGQPEPLLSLSEEEQLKAKKLLSDRLAALTKLADQLAELEPGSEELQTLLRKAVQFPGDKSVYVINDQPIITFWGIPDPAKKVVSLSNTPLPNNPKVIETINDSKSNSKFRAARFLSYLAWPLIFILLAGLLWYGLSRYPVNWQDYNPFVDEYQVLLDKVNAVGDDCTDLESIYTDEPLIHKTEEKFILLKKRVESQLDICRAYAQLKDEIELAQNDCQKLVSILNQSQYLQNAQIPFLELKKTLKKEVQLCAEYQQLKHQIDSAKNNCPLLSQINSENLHLQHPEGMFVSLKQQIGQNIQNCKKRQVEVLPEVFGAEFVEGFAVFTLNTKKRAFKEMKLIGEYLSNNKNASVLITLHTPVTGPDDKNTLAYKSGFNTAKDVLDARFQTVVNGILKVPGVSKHQIKKNPYRYKMPNRIVRFSIR